MATIGAQSFLWVVLAAATVAALAGSAFAVWSQRPVPAYSSEGVEVGSHLVDSELGGRSSDPVGLALITAAAVAGVVARRRMLRQPAASAEAAEVAP